MSQCQDRRTGPYVFGKIEFKNAGDGRTFFKRAKDIFRHVRDAKIEGYIFGHEGVPLTGKRKRPLIGRRSLEEKGYEGRRTLFDRLTGLGTTNTYLDIFSEHMDDQDMPSTIHVGTVDHLSGNIYIDLGGRCGYSRFSILSPRDCPVSQARLREQLKLDVALANGIIEALLPEMVAHLGIKIEQKDVILTPDFDETTD